MGEMKKLLENLNESKILDEQDQMLNDEEYIQNELKKIYDDMEYERFNNVFNDGYDAGVDTALLVLGVANILVLLATYSLLYFLGIS